MSDANKKANGKLFCAGQIIPLRYKSRKMKTIFIDPNGLGEDRPSIGLSFRSMKCLSYNLLNALA